MNKHFNIPKGLEDNMLRRLAYILNALILILILSKTWDICIFRAETPHMISHIDILSSVQIE